MAGTDSLLPGYTPSSGGETPPPGGMRGEVADNPDLDRPEFRREVVLEQARVIIVEEASGTAFAEATGAAERAAPPPAAAESVEPSSVAPPSVEASPAEILSAAPTRAEPALWQRPAVLAAAFASGILLAMLTRSTRRRQPDTSEHDAPAAFAVSVGSSFDQTRDAGPEHMRDETGERWDVIDEGSDESFPASDPPSYSRGAT